MRNRKFESLSRQEEIELMLSDDMNFAHTKLYLDSLIVQSLDRLDFPPRISHRLHEELLSDIPFAASRFLLSDKSMKADYKFCTYFTWYIKQRVDMLEMSEIKSSRS